MILSRGGASLLPADCLRVCLCHAAIAAPAGAADADDLLEALVAGEEANFGLFNYVNDLSGEVDKLEEGIGSLRWAGGQAGRRAGGQAGGQQGVGWAGVGCFGQG
jgi:hypothetical protein